jgi:hypothetical protein
VTEVVRGRTLNKTLEIPSSSSPARSNQELSNPLPHNLRCSNGPLPSTTPMDPKRRAGSRAAPRAPRPSIQRRPQLPNPRAGNSSMQMEPRIIFTQPRHPSTALELHRLGQEPPVPVLVKDQHPLSDQCHLQKPLQRRYLHHYIRPTLPQQVSQIGQYPRHRQACFRHIFLREGGGSVSSRQRDRKEAMPGLVAFQYSTIWQLRNKLNPQRVRPVHRHKAQLASRL